MPTFNVPNLLRIIPIVLLAACGGAETSSVSFNVIKVFSDGAGVGRGVASTRGELVYIADNIVADVAASNSTADTSEGLDVTTYPIISQTNGYNLRQGAEVIDGTSYNIEIFEKIGSEVASILYIYNNSSDAIASVSAAVSSIPSGSHTYTGLYVAGSRSTSFSETGSMSLTANFSSNTFTTNNSSASTSLTGSGYIDPSNGRLSSGVLTFTSPSSSTYSASTMGNLSGVGATELSGVFYTNDYNPDYAGAYAGSR